MNVHFHPLGIVDSACWFVQPRATDFVARTWQEEPPKALEQLRVVLGVCTAFKDAYATYKCVYICVCLYM